MRFDFLNYKRDTLGGMLFQLMLAFSSLLVVALLFFNVYLPETTHHDRSLTVPDVEGMAISQLDELLGKRALRFGVNDSAYSTAHPPRTVLRQYPPAGSKVKAGRVILVSVNRVDPPTVPLPDLVDRSVVHADALLSSNELKRGGIEYVSGPFPVVKEVKYRGHILVVGEHLPKGSIVDLVVMDGKGNSPDDSVTLKNE